MLTGAVVAAAVALGVGTARDVAAGRAAGARLVGGSRRRGAPTQGTVLRHLVHRLARAVRGAPSPPLVGFLDALARSLRTGATVRAALEEARPAADRRLAGALDRVLADVALGTPPAEALRRWGRRSGDPGVRLLAAAVVLGRVGGDLARAVDGVAAAERQRAAVRAEVLAQSAQARLSAVVVAGAPVAFTVLAATAEPRVAAFLVGTVPGWACLLGGVALDAVGLTWMVRITRAAA